MCSSRASSARRGGRSSRIGAVAADGTRVIDHELVRMLHVSEQYIEKITAREIAEAQRRLALFRGSAASATGPRPRRDPRG